MGWQLFGEVQQVFGIFKCFEGEILNLLLRIKKRREQSKKRGISVTTKFEHELKKLVFH